MTDELLPSGISDGRLRASGLVAVKSSRLEGFVYRIAYLFQSAEPNASRSITTHMDLPRLLDVMRSFTGLAAPDTPQHKAILKWARYVKEKLLPKRNDLIHTWWRPDRTDDALIAAIKHRARGLYRVEQLQKTVAEINETAQEIDKACRRLVEIVRPIWPHLAEASDGKPL